LQHLDDPSSRAAEHQRNLRKRRPPGKIMSPQVEPQDPETIFSASAG
jgi:hypothetical protein